ncbi:WAP four-disulfide core domain protein 8 [Hipposideros larvatus]
MEETVRTRAESLKGCEFRHVFLAGKPGTCPEERLTCRATIPNLCRTDFNCDGYLKCCSFACGKKCIDLYEEPCMLLLDPGYCNSVTQRWYFDVNHKLCIPFKYGGCLGNANNFLSKEDCLKACALTDKKGLCPAFPFKDQMQCSTLCRSDNDCPDIEKCCDSTCGFVCVTPWKDSPNWSQTMIKSFKVKCLVLSRKVKAGFCPQKPSLCSKIDKPKCMKDEDCPLSEKCCLRCGLKCLEPKD